MKADWRNRDLPAVFRTLELTSGWHTAPSKSIASLARLNDFYRIMFRLFRNGMLPTRRLDDALKNVEQHRDVAGAQPYRWNSANRALNEAAAALGTVMCVGASKLRDMATDGRVKTISLTGVSGDVYNAITELCNMIAPKCTTTASAVVAASPVPAPPLASADEFGCNMAIFDRFLSGGDFDPPPPISRASSVVSLSASSALRGSMGAGSDCGSTQTDPGSAPTPATTTGASRCPDGEQVLLYSHANPGAASRASIGTQPPSPQMEARSCCVAGESGRPSGEERTYDDSKGTHLFFRPGQQVAQSYVSLRSAPTATKKHVQPGRRRKDKKAGGPVTPARVVVPRGSKVVAKSSAPSGQGKDPRRNHCCRAYRKALRQAITDGKANEAARAYAQAAYAKAGREFKKAALRS